MAKDPQFGVPITPSEASLGLPFYPMYGVTPSDEYIPLQITADGKLATTATLTGSITIGEIGAPDETPFIYGTTLEQTMGGVYQDASPTLSAGQAGAVRLTEYRAFHSNLRDSSGNELLGQNASADSIPVVLASDQSTVPVSFSGNVTVVQPTGTNLHTVVDSGSISVSNFPATQVVAQADQNTSGSISALNGTVTLPLTYGAGSCEVYLSGVFSASLNVQGTVDNVNWSSLLTASGSTGLYSTTAVTTTGKLRVFRTSSLVAIRVIATSYTSGTVSVVINAAAPTGIVEVVQQNAANLLVTATPSALPASAGFGQTTIAITGTAVNLASNPLVNGVVISSNVSNVASIVIGSSSVTNVTNGTGNGYVLAPGASIGIAVANTNALWVNGTSGDVVSFVGS